MFLKQASVYALMASLYQSVARHLSIIAITSVFCLVLVSPARVNAYTILLRTAPTKDAFLSGTPGQIRLWFSAAVDPAFSTAVVENAAHEYVNTRDAYLSPRDAREMDVPLPPHLSPGVYTVIWRADSDSDGLVLSGAYMFSILRPGGMAPQQSSHLPEPFPGQFDDLAGSRFFLVLPLVAAICLWLLYILRTANANNARRSLARQQSYQGFERRAPFFKKKHILCFTPPLRWESIASMAILIGLGLSIVLSLLQGVPNIFSLTLASSKTVPYLQQGTLPVLTAFHASARTEDKQFSIVLDINTTHSSTSTFTMSMTDANSGNPVADVSVVLFTTMLDMHMGSDTIIARPDGNGYFSAQSDLSMGGLWQIGIGLQTPDRKLHEAFVKVLIPY